MRQSDSLMGDFFRQALGLKGHDNFHLVDLSHLGCTGVQSTMMIMMCVTMPLQTDALVDNFRGDMILFFSSRNHPDHKLCFISDHRNNECYEMIT